MTRERRDIDSALTGKGFEREQGRDHHSYRLYIGKTKQAIGTRMSMGTSHRTIGDPLLGKMARQLMLTKSDFLDLVDCDMDGPAYIAKLRANGTPIAENPAAAAVPANKPKK